MDWRATWRPWPSRDPRGGTEPEAPETGGGQVRYLHIVARTRLDLFLTLRRRFRNDGSVHVMLDRRERERRRQSSQAVFTDRRRLPDRRRPREYWEDIAYHPAIIIPLGPRQPHADVSPGPVAPDTSPQERDASTDPGLTPERLLAWVEESRHLVQQVFPAIVDERDAVRARLEEATRRCRDLEAECDALRAEVAHLTEAHRQLEEDHADVTGRIGEFLAQVGGALAPLRELQRRRPRPATTRPAGPPAASPRPGRILVADAEPVEAAALRDALAQHGHTVKVAGGGREALGLVQAFEPDVVLLDVTVPDPPAVEVIDQIRSLDPDLPVVVASAAQHEKDALGLLARGAFDYLSKPFSLEVVERVVAAAVARRRA